MFNVPLLFHAMLDIPPCNPENDDVVLNFRDIGSHIFFTHTITHTITLVHSPTFNFD